MYTAPTRECTQWLSMTMMTYAKCSIYHETIIKANAQPMKEYVRFPNGIHVQGRALSESVQRHHAATLPILVDSNHLTGRCEYWRKVAVVDRAGSRRVAHSKRKWMLKSECRATFLSASKSIVLESRVREFLDWITGARTALD